MDLRATSVPINDCARREWHKGHMNMRWIKVHPMGFTDMVMKSLRWGGKW